MALLKWKVADANCGETASLANLIAGAAFGNTLHRFDDTKTIATFCAESIEFEKETLSEHLGAMKEIANTLNQNQREIDKLDDNSSLKDVVRVLKRTHKSMTKAVKSAGKKTLCSDYVMMDKKRGAYRKLRDAFNKNNNSQRSFTQAVKKCAIRTIRAAPPS